MGRVIVIGAGPVGLTAAAVLTARGVDCLVLEKRAGLSTASKASTFHPPTLEILAEFGILGPILERGRKATHIQYRDQDGVFAEFDHALLADRTPYPFRLHLEQSAITPLLKQAVEVSGHGEVRFGAELRALRQDAQGVTVEWSDTEGQIHEERADFAIGADGAGSATRDLLGLTLEGTHYPGKVLRLVVTDPLEQILPGIGQISYVFREDGRSVSLLQMPDCWRVIIRLPDGFDEAEVTRPEWYMAELGSFIPGLPKRLTLRSWDIYGARKMLASGHGAARTFLIGDALHLTNTRGGMNMNCGIHDAYTLGNAIAQALASGQPALAEAAARERRRVAEQELLPRTDRNVRGGADWLDEVRRRAADADSARDMLVRTTMLDMAPPRLAPESAQ
ncbi:MAG: FAD-dependent monooxygenase [Paracoccus sp. (in: a-proteobacteria)]|uniref:FAD-dependent oxidoreductase n=1 Tax=Paracoccus sp. TaxID=267 RepID=UPI0039E63F53